MAGRARFGRFHLSTKGYPRYHSGYYKGQYVHRVAYIKHLERQFERGRSKTKTLSKNLDVHHRNNNKLDWRVRNLKSIDHREHGFISAKQSWYVRNVVEPKRKKEWDEHFCEDVSFDITQMEEYV